MLNHIVSHIRVYLVQGHHKRTEQTQLARSKPLDPEDVLEASTKKGRGGRGRGRGRGGCGRSGSSKNLKRLKSFKKTAKARASQADGEWDADVLWEWYLFQGWSEQEIREWCGCHPESNEASGPKKRVRGKSRPSLEEDDAPQVSSTPKLKEKEKIKGQVGKKEVSFARRPPPKLKDGITYQRWDAVRTAFVDKVSYYVYPPGKYQARIF